MSCKIFYTIIVGVLFLVPSTHAEVRVIDRTKETQNSNDTPTLAAKKEEISPRAQRLNATYVLEDRNTGKVISFHSTTIDEVVEGLHAVDVPMDKWHSCSKEPTETSTDPTLEDIERALDIALLIESLAKVPAPELTDSQRDWVKSLSPCAQDMRLHLKALSLILSNYKLIKKPEA